MQASTTSRRSLRRRGKAMIATLVAMTALVGGVQALAPASAGAMPRICDGYYYNSGYYRLIGDNIKAEEEMRRYFRCVESESIPA